MTAALDAAALFRALHDAGVEHVVVGGFAVIAHGVVRATKDLDVCPDPERANLERLAGLLRDLGARQVGVGDFEEDAFPLDPTVVDDLAKGGNFLVETELGRLDIMQWLAGADSDDVYAWLSEDALAAEVHGVPVRVASLVRLRAMKQAAGRPQDLRDLEDLADGHGQGA